MSAEALAKVKIPATGLIIIGVLNGLFALFNIIANLFNIGGVDPEQFEGLPPEFAEVLAASGGAIGVVFGLVQLAVAGLAIYGGLQMKKLQSYGLAIAASILVMIPCITPCICCVLGLVFGIWSLVVLFNAEVKQAFN